MNLRFSVHQSFADLPVDWKNNVVDKSVCRGIDMVENASIPNMKNYYVVTYHNDEMAFVSYYQLLSVKPEHFNMKHRPNLGKALDIALKVVKPTLLVAGNLFRHDVLFFIYLKDNFSDDEKATLYEATVAHMTTYTNASGIFLKDVETSVANYIQKDNSFLQMQDDISMEIEIKPTWKNFEDYEKELKHKYLQRSRKIRKAFDGIKVRELNSHEIGHYSQAMEKLYLQVTQKQLVSMGNINQNFFLELKKSLQQDYKVCGFFLDDKLIAFSSAILHHGEYDMNYIGIDYAYNQSHQLYFNILFHCLENAMATGSQKLILGRTALEAKAILGCVPEYRFSFYKLRNVIVNWFYKRISNNFNEAQGEKWKERHPFKSSYYETIVADNS